ncbi:MAG: hypothetical protein LBH13_04755 [Cellulomonadaceae bacterium]|jgi:predicted RNA methylase|nr:hypothetical protein [Cellulomonadaceae bacterium]
MPSAKLGNPRVTGKEQYYTHPDLASRLTDTMLRVVGTDKVQQTWVEPAGGTGVFIDALQARGVTSIISYDIEPHHDLVLPGDFLEITLVGSQMVALTNPPFGRANKLCIPFFNKLAQNCTHIGFIVPKSWRKWSVQNRLDQRFHLVHDEDLTVNYVDAVGDPLADGKTHLNTVFQIWEKRDDVRPKHTVEDRGYVTKTTPQRADVSLTIFGHGCGTVKTEFPRKNNSTQMFLTLNHPHVLGALQNANLQQFFENVAYIPALSIKEIHHALNEYVDAHRISIPRDNELFPLHFNS